MGGTRSNAAAPARPMSRVIVRSPFRLSAGRRGFLRGVWVGEYSERGQISGNYHPPVTPEAAGSSPVTPATSSEPPERQRSCGFREGAQRFFTTRLTMRWSRHGCRSVTATPWRALLVQQIHRSNQPTTRIRGPTATQDPTASPIVGCAALEGGRGGRGDGERLTAGSEVDRHAHEGVVAQVVGGQVDAGVPKFNFCVWCGHEPILRDRRCAGTKTIP